MKKNILILTIVFQVLAITACSNPNANKIKIDYPAVLPELFGSDPSFYALYFSSREIDSSLTSNCGIATPATATSTGATGTTATTTTSTSSSTSNTKFTILNQYIMKNTKETLNFKFVYDSTQTRGSIDQQQGFAITGGFYGATLSGKQGSVTWGIGGTGLGYIDESNTGSQQLSYMKGIQLSLSNATFTPNSISSTTTPNQCYTLDNVFCTAQTTATQCFTQDNKTCVGINTTSSTSVVIPVLNITLNCESSTVIPN